MVRNNMMAAIVIAGLSAIDSSYPFDPARIGKREKPIPLYSDEEKLAKAEAKRKRRSLRNSKQADAPKVMR